MRKITDQIAKFEEKLEQQRQRLRDLKAQETKQARKDDTRRKILYGAAYLAGVEQLSEGAQEKSRARVHAQILNKRDREFLGLPPISSDQAVEARKDCPADQGERELPFGQRSK